MRTLSFLLVPLLLLVACQSSPEPAAPDAQGQVEPSATAEPPVTADPTEEPTPEATLEPVELTWHSLFGGSTHAKWDADTIDRYETANPQVMIIQKFTALYNAPVPTDALDAMLTTEPVPDVVSGYIAGGALGKHIAEGRLMDLSPLWEEMGWHDQFPQSIIDMATVDGRQYFVPHAIQWNPIFYRADIFDELDLAPPDTWDELLSLCDTLSGEGYRPFTVSTSSWTPPTARWFTILDLRLNGPEFHARLMRGAEALDSNEVRAVFEAWREMLERGCFGAKASGTSYAAAVREFAEDEAVMYNLGEWLFESQPIADLDESQIDFFRFPILRADVPNGEIAHVYGSYIPADAPHPEAARDFLGWLGSAETQQTVVEEVGRLVASYEVPRDVLLPRHASGLTFIEESESLFPLFEFGMWEADVASAGLQGFVRMFTTWEDPDAIDLILSTLEAARQEALVESK